MDGIRATPYINPLLGSVNELVGGLLGYMRDPRRTQQLQGLAGLLESTGVPKTLERLAYGEPLTNIQRANVPVLRPETAEALLTLSPVPQATSRAAMAAGRAGERMAERVVPQIMERGGMPAGLLESMSQGAKSNVITEETLPILKAMTKEQFLGKPKIVGKSDAADLKPVELKSLQNVEQVPFLDKYTAKFSEDGAVVFDKDKPIASYNFGDTLTVDKKYRGQGIGEELVYQWRTSYPAPAVASTRNKMSQALQEKVWERIQKDIPENDGLLTIQKRNNEVIAPTSLLDYRIQHRPMTVEGGASKLHEAGSVFGEDVYGKNALQYFGSGLSGEKTSLDILKKVRGNPDAEITIYRGVPKGVNTINKGDWVTLDPKMAEEYGNVISKKVKAKDITTWPDSLVEFGYYPD
jgi:hypothetical protein